MLARNLELERFAHGKKVIFFDLYGTLIRKQISPAQALGEALSSYTARWEAEEKEALIKRVGKVYAHAIRKYKKRKSGELDEKTRRAAMKQAIASLPLPRDDETIAAIDREYMSIMRNSRQHTSSTNAAVLRRLNQRYRLAIISNGRKSSVRSSIRRNRLERQFGQRSIIASSSFGKGKGKPHQMIFKHALSILNVKPQDALMVGDSWPHDIVGATRCGIDAIWLNNTYEMTQIRPLHDAHVMNIRTLDELLDVLM